MDFNHLECIVLAQGNEDHHQLVRNVNEEWAQPLGFTLKMKWSPKENLKGEKSVKLYCASSRCNTTRADVTEIEESTGLKEEYCFFALSFWYVVDSKTWILNNEYAQDLMWHTHPFYHSYTNYSGSSVSSKSSRTFRITPSKVGLQNATFAIQYLKSYKSSLAKLK